MDVLFACLGMVWLVASGIVTALWHPMRTGEPGELQFFFGMFLAGGFGAMSFIALAATMRWQAVSIFVFFTVLSILLAVLAFWRNHRQKI